jgi:hypothetical protein
MILSDQVEKIRQHDVALIFGYTIDALCKAFVHVYTLPPCHWIGSNERVNGRKISSNIERRPSLTFTEGIP